jgi:hypothetical protein
VVNESKELVDIRIRITMDGFTPDGGSIAIERVRISPEHLVSIPVRNLSLEPSILRQRHVIPVEAKLDVSDISDEIRKKATTDTRTIVRSVNSLLMDDVAKLASFISSTDSSVRSFALSCLEGAEKLESEDLDRSIFRAVVLFEALHGMSYAYDPNVPFESGTVDDVRFPREILGMLSETDLAFGDCDDSTVLYCSLLESVGVHTALIKQPKHVLMAFKVENMTLEKALGMDLDDGSYIPIDGYAWIPVETTLIGDGFIQAWKSGLERMKAMNGIEDITTTQEAWERYGSVEIEGVFDTPIRYSIPPRNKLLDRVEEALNSQWISKWRGAK